MPILISLDMIGNGYTIFNGRTSEELRKSILKRKTSFGGSRTPLSECISWSKEIAIESIKMIYNSLRGEKSQDILYSEIDKTTKKTKALGLIGAALYKILIYGDSQRAKPNIPAPSSSVRFTQNLPVLLKLKFILAFCPLKFPRIKVSLPTCHWYLIIVFSLLSLNEVHGQLCGG